MARIILNMNKKFQDKIADIQQSKADENDESWKEHQFWYVKYKIQNDKEIIDNNSINQKKLCEFLYANGFRRYNINEVTIFIQIQNKIVKVVEVHHIQDFVFDWIDGLPYYLDEHELFSKDMLIEKLLKSIGTYFNEQKLYYLRSKEEIIWHKDTLNEKYFYFQNGYVTVTKDKINFNSYDDLPACIWNDQILPRDFQLTNKKLITPVEQFFYLVSNSDVNRFKDLKIITGYYLHNYFDYKLRSVLITDSTISEDDESNGRSGKTLWGKLISAMISGNGNNTENKSFVEINGKEFKPEEKDKYQSCSHNTQVVMINDLKKNFDVDHVYNDVTEGIMVKLLYKQVFRIYVKMILTTNKTIRITGDSSRDRFIEFEFSNYFNATHSPEKEFGHWFFRDWNKQQWLAFDTFMINCVKEFFANNKELNKPDMINLNVRKLREQTSLEFVEYMEQIWKPNHNEWYKFQVRYKLFTEMYPDYTKLKEKTFADWIKLFMKYSPIYKDFKKSDMHRRTAEGTEYRFIKVEYENI